MVFPGEVKVVVSGVSWRGQSVWLVVFPGEVKGVRGVLRRCDRRLLPQGNVASKGEAI